MSRSDWQVLTKQIRPVLGLEIYGKVYINHTRATTALAKRMAARVKYILVKTNPDKYSYANIGYSGTRALEQKLAKRARPYAKSYVGKWLK